MRKRTFVAFYPSLIYAIISSFMLFIAGMIFYEGRGLNNWEWIKNNVMEVVIFSFCVGIPVGCVFFLPRMTIDLNYNKIDIFYLVNWKKNRLDSDSNWVFYPDQVERVTLVKLSKNDKKKYTSSRFLFHKYLKIEFKFGNVKYLYISPYSKNQINKIIKMLTKQS